MEEEAEELPARIRERGIRYKYDNKDMTKKFYLPHHLRLPPFPSRFASASKKDGDRVWTFLRRNFFPDEPVFRSIKFCDSDLVRLWCMKWYYVYLRMHM